MTHSAAYLRTRTSVRYVLGFTLLAIVCLAPMVAATY